MQRSIRITSAALARTDTDIILRGVLDSASLSALKVAGYQREIQSRTGIRKIMTGFTTRGGVPNVELGMRGHSFTQAGGDFLLHDATYIIDGLQRWAAALEVIEQGGTPRLGVTIHFDTAVGWPSFLSMIRRSRVCVVPMNTGRPSFTFTSPIT
jgi:hypothetical protein